MKKILIPFILLLFFSCEKVTYYPDNPIIFDHSVILSHHGLSDLYGENTYEGCIAALPLTDGIEVDVQISKDRTIWLSHSSAVVYCGEEGRCFAETTDEEIESIDSCNGADISYTKLEEVLKYMDDNDIRKNVSIDIKGWEPCSGNSINVEAIMRLEVEQVISLGDKYQLTPYLLFECNLGSVLNYAKKINSSVGTYIYSYGDFEKGMLVALDNGFSGISYKANFGDSLDIDKTNLLHKKGLRLLTWNIPDSTYAKYLISINTDILEVDL